jgi:hypothetical protein
LSGSNGRGEGVILLLLLLLQCPKERGGEERGSSPASEQIDEVEEGRGNRASHAPMRWKKENLDRSLAGDGGDSGVVMFLL